MEYSYATQINIYKSPNEDNTARCPENQIRLYPRGTGNLPENRPKMSPDQIVLYPQCNSFQVN